MTQRNGQNPITVKTKSESVSFGPGDLVKFSKGLSCKWEVTNFQLPTSRTEFPSYLFSRVTRFFFESIAHGAWATAFRVNASITL